MNLRGGNMRRFNLSLMIGSAFVAGALVSTTPTEAQNGLDVLGAAAAITAGAIAGAYFWGGHNYCWYPYGWNGPGWYWCGAYYNQPGYGWGGGEGWHGWRRGGPGPGHGGPGHGGPGHGGHMGGPKGGPGPKGGKGGHK
jgi:hypothetical protein